MKKHLIISCAAGLLLASCGNKNTTEQTPADATPESGISLVGKWVIESVAVNDTASINLAETEISPAPAIVFYADGTIGISTDCNSIGGNYIHSGDSISFQNLLQTTMACENMELETMLSQVLPEIKTMEAANDSTIRLNGNGTLPCINLRKTAGE